MGSSILSKASVFSNRAASGFRLVTDATPIVNKAHALNGSAYSSGELVTHYLTKAKGGATMRDFLGHGPNKTDYLNIPNGGITKPRDTGIWAGTLFRVAYVPKGSSESVVVHTGVSGEWWMRRETFVSIAQKADAASELLEYLRAELALGFKLDDSTTRIIAVPVNGPIAAYSGRGNVTSDGYDNSQFPILYGNPLLSQLFIPGIRDRQNAPDKGVIKSCLDVDSTNSFDAVGALARFGGMK